MEAAASSSVVGGDQDWQQEMMKWLQSWHTKFVTRGEEWLQYAASVDLSASDSAAESWQEEWSQFTAFGSWPGWSVYHQVMIDAFNDGVKGAQSVGYWIWLTVQPILYSATYILGRVLQVLLGTLLPRLQYAFVAICRFHLHLTWQQALGEITAIILVVVTWKTVRFLRRYLQRKQYLRRFRTYMRQTSQQVTKVRFILLSFGY